MSSPTKRKSCQDELAAGNILGLSRVLNSQSSRKHQHRRNHTASITPSYDEQIQLVRLFLERLSDPLTIIPIVVEMRNNVINYSSGLNSVLVDVMEDWLTPYITLFIEQDTPYNKVLEKKTNKLGCIFLKILEKQDEQSALLFVSNNLNHLQFISDTYRDLMSSILQGQCLAQYVIRFAMGGQLYFLHTLINIIKKATINNANNIQKLNKILREWCTDEKQTLKICQMPINHFFTERYSRLCTKFKYQ